MRQAEDRTVEARKDAAASRSGAAEAVVRRRGIPWQARLIVLAAIWGMSFLFIKVGVEVLAPLQVTLGRMALGTATLLILLRARRERLPDDPRVWRHLAVVAIVANVIPFSLFAYGETLTTSVLAGIWNATTPLFTAPLAMLMLRDEPLTRSRIVGLVVGFSGVLVVLGVWQGMGDGQLTGNLMCLGASASYGLAFPYMRKYLAGRGDSVLSLAAGQLMCGTIELAIIATFFTAMPSAMPLKVVASVLALGVFGTGIAYVINYGLIRDTGATTTSTVTYLIPLFSTVAGVVVLGEPLTWYEPVGGIIVILGVAISQNKLARALGRSDARARALSGSRHDASALDHSDCEK
jgi:drug/metabolite transporter (DMT)-like permease